jgi:hypothetical protein
LEAPETLSGIRVRFDIGSRLTRTDVRIHTRRAGADDAAALTFLEELMI